MTKFIEIHAKKSLQIFVILLITLVSSILSFKYQTNQRISSNLFFLQNKLKNLQKSHKNMINRDIWILGEVLIDLIPTSTSFNEYIPVVGGGGANTAITTAKLGYNTQFINGFSSDDYGILCKQHLLSNNVSLTYSMVSNLHTAIAKVQLNEEKSAFYSFQLQNTSTFDYCESWLPDCDVIHEDFLPKVIQVGTLVSIIEPGASKLFNWLLRVMKKQSNVLIMFDPNIRPAVLSNRLMYLQLIDRWIRISSVIKLSDEDLSWLYPEESPQVIVNQWFHDVNTLKLVVITHGSKGMTGYTRSSHVSVEAMKIDEDLIDTIGAGDTVGGVIIEGLLLNDLDVIQDDISLLKRILTKASIAAGLCCSKAGANPPSKHELEQYIITHDYQL